MVSKTDFDGCINALANAGLASNVSLRKISKELSAEVERVKKDIRKYEPSLMEEEVNAKAHRMAIELLQDNFKVLRQKEILNTKARLELTRFMGEDKYSKVAGLRRRIEYTNAESKGIMAEAINNNLNEFVEKNAGLPLRLDRLYSNNKPLLDDMIRASYGEPSAHPLAKGFMDAVIKTYDTLINGFAQFGIKINKIDNFNAPHQYNYRSVQKDGQDKFVERAIKTWDVEKINKVRNRAIQSDAELVDYAKNIYNDMMDNLEGTDRSYGYRRSLGDKMGNRLNRKIYFKNADAEIEFLDAYGSGNLYTNIINELESLSKDIAILRSFGPDADENFKYASIQAAADHVKRAISKKRGDKGQKVLSNPVLDIEKMWKVETGVVNQVANPIAADLVAGFKGLAKSKSLGRVAVVSIPDLGNQISELHLLGLQTRKILANDMGNLFKLGPEEKLNAIRKVSIALERIGTAARLETKLVDNNVFGKFSKVGNMFTDFVMRTGQAIRIQQSLKEVTGYLISSEVAEQAGVPLSKLSKPVKEMLYEFDINEKDWLAISSSVTEYEVHPTMAQKILGKDKPWTESYVDPEKLKKNSFEAFMKWQGMLSEYTRRAIKEPTIETQAIMTQGAKAGSPERIAVELPLELKSFTITQTLDALRAGLDSRIGNKYAYYSKWAAMMLGLGALSKTLTNEIDGKETNWNDPMLYLDIINRAGTLGVAQDFVDIGTRTKFKEDPYTASTQLIAKLAGLTPNYVGGGIAAIGNAIARHDQKGLDNLGIWASKNYPGSNLWYKTMIMNQLRKHNLIEGGAPQKNKKMKEARKRINGRLDEDK